MGSATGMMSTLVSEFIQIKHCGGCKQAKPHSEFHRRNTGNGNRIQSKCKTCTNTYTKAWRGRNVDKVKNYHTQYSQANPEYARERWLARYGLTVDSYNELLAQQEGVCAICKHECSVNEVLSVDHDHDTNAVRGLLCLQCNAGLGYFGDNTARLLVAAEYLRQFDAG